MRGWSEIELGGNISDAPVLRKLPGGDKSVCDVRLAVNTGKDTDAQWYKVVFFGGAADTVVKHLKKGDGLRVCGPLVIETWTKDGVQHFQPVCNVDKFNFIGGGKNAPSPSAESLADVKVPF